MEALVLGLRLELARRRREVRSKYFSQIFRTTSVSEERASQLFDAMWSRREAALSKAIADLFGSCEELN